MLCSLALVAAWYWHWGTGARNLVQALRDTGPLPFFLAMALLPAVGFPLAVFNFAAGPAFVPLLGVTRVCLLSSAAIAVNVATTYWLARYAFRPVFARLLSWLGYPIPKIPLKRHLELVFLVRVTPGPPFFLQSCLLGLAEIPFIHYMLGSWSVASAYAMVAIIGGDALMRNDVRAGLFAFALLGCLALVFRLFRGRLRSKTNP